MSREQNHPLETGFRPAEAEMVAFFTRMAAALGLPKSIGQIFGFLFCSSSPRALDHITEQLLISKGSASQGLRLLQQLGAIRPVYPPQERRTHYVAETSLRRLFAFFVEQTVRPHLDASGQQLDLIERLLGEQESVPPGSLLAQRLQSLRAWNENLQELLPVITSLVATPENQGPSPD